jgi:sec-independent protein translocase protein TatB
MFDISWAHLAVIAAVALVVIGPKDLPRVLRTAGQWMARARAVAREFQNSLDQMVREAELDDVRKQVQAATDVNLGHEIERSIDPGGDMQRGLSQSALTGEAAPPPASEPTPTPASEPTSLTPASEPTSPPPASESTSSTPASDPTPAVPAADESTADPAPSAASGTHA